MFHNEPIVSFCLLMIKIIIIAGILWLALLCEPSGFNGDGN